MRMLGPLALGELKLVSLDCEATGTDPKQNRMVSIAVTEYHRDTEPEKWGHLLNPQEHIPSEVAELIGITDEMVADCPKFENIATTLLFRLADVDVFFGHGVRFDLDLLVAEFIRTGIKYDLETHEPFIIDSLQLSRLLHPHDLSSAYERWTGKKAENAHNAAEDVRMAEETLVGMLERNPDLPRDIEALARMLNVPRRGCLDVEGKFIWRDGKATVNFGKYKGSDMRTVPKDYWDFMRKAAFRADTRKIAFDALKGIFPEKL